MDRLYENQVTVPAATPDTAPFSAQWALEDAQLVYVELIIPPGHAGLTGIRLSRAGTPIIPFKIGTWIISDDEKLTIPFNGEITATGLTIEAYNNDIFDHLFYMRAAIRDLSTQSIAAAAGPAFLPSDVISNMSVLAGP